MDYFDLVSVACCKAQQAAREHPGLYGGRYVGRFLDGPRAGQVIVLQDDDPLEVPDNIDVLAHCTPERITGIGHVRYWLNNDGTIDRSQFDRAAE